VTRDPKEKKPASIFDDIAKEAASDQETYEKKAQEAFDAEFGFGDMDLAEEGMGDVATDQMEIDDYDFEQDAVMDDGLDMYSGALG
jgi:hypothetical protein